MYAERGFTLLEVIVALAIASFAFAGLFRAGGSGLFAVDTATRTEEAVERAQSHLAAVGKDAALLEGDFDGDDGGGYRWRLRVRPMATEQAAVQQGEFSTKITLFDVEVAISWNASGHDRSVVLRSRRLVATAPQG
jgi:general secretion pathway protein I